MAKVLVAYFSASGVTARVAHALARDQAGAALYGEGLELDGQTKPLFARDGRRRLPPRPRRDDRCRKVRRCVCRLPRLVGDRAARHSGVFGERRVRRQDGRALLHFRWQRRRQDGRGLAQVLLGADKMEAVQEIERSNLAARARCVCRVLETVRRVKNRGQDRKMQRQV